MVSQTIRVLTLRTVPLDVDTGCGVSTPAICTASIHTFHHSTRTTSRAHSGGVWNTKTHPWTSDTEKYHCKASLSCTQLRRQVDNDLATLAREIQRVTTHA